MATPLIPERTSPSAPGAQTAWSGPRLRTARGRPLLRRLLIVSDVVAVLLGWTLAAWAQGDRSGEAAAVVVLLVAGHLTAIRLNHLYRSRVSAVRSSEIAGIGRSATITTGAAVVVSLATDLPLSRPSLLVGGAATFVTLLVARSAYRVWLASSRRSGRFTRRVVIVGANAESASLLEIIGEHPEHGVVVSAVVGDPDEAAAAGLVTTGDVDEATAAIESGRADGAIVVVSAFDVDTLNRITRDLLRIGAHVQITSSLRGIDHRRLQAQPLAFEPLFHLEPARLSTIQLAVKRAIDVAAAAVLLVLTAPLTGVLALAVRLTDGGPALFRQTRVGRNGQPFEILKLRTMIVDAEARMAELLAENERKGPLFKMDHDPRLTRVGRFLDASSLNELPQLWNVLRGDMSLVGPRPALPRETEGFDDALHQRHEVRPGITGLWQVEARDNPSFSAYRRFDLYYIENWSVALDLVIMVATVEAVLSRMLRLLVSRGRPAGPE